jgi:hypothetical protein
VLGAPVLHAPVLALDLVPAARRPLSRRLFGANKTWRGAVVMQTGPLLATLGLFRSRAYRERLPAPLAAANPVTVGALLGLSVWAGELPNSFVKRRIGIPPGQQLRGPLGLAISAFDQVDWVPAALLLLRPLWRATPRQAAELVALVAAVHVPINLIGHAIGARTTRV